MTEKKHTPIDRTDRSREIAITDRMYVAYSSDTGILLGISADLRGSVETIVKIAIEESGAPTLQAKIDRLEAEKAELVESCQFFVTALETGLLVRDITKDSAPEWSFKMMDFVRQLQKAQIAIAKAEPR